MDCGTKISDLDSGVLTLCSLSFLLTVVYDDHAHQNTLSIDTVKRPSNVTHFFSCFHCFLSTLFFTILLPCASKSPSITVSQGLFPLCFLSIDTCTHFRRTFSAPYNPSFLESHWHVRSLIYTCLVNAACASIKCTDALDSSSLATVVISQIFLYLQGGCIISLLQLVQLCLFHSHVAQLCSRHCYTLTCV